jgi:hypothetical protein
MLFGKERPFRNPPPAESTRESYEFYFLPERLASGFGPWEAIWAVGTPVVLERFTEPVDGAPSVLGSAGGMVQGAWPL